MHIRKEHPGSAPGFEWTHPGQVHEVPDDLAYELLQEPHRSAGGFSEAPPPEPTDDGDETGETGGAGTLPGENTGPDPKKQVPTKARRTAVAE